MSTQNPLASAESAEGDEETPSSTRNGLEKLKSKLPKKSELFKMTADLLANFNTMDTAERKKQMIKILQLSALVWLLADEKREEEAAEQEEAGAKDEPTTEEASTEEAAEAESEEDDEKKESDETESDARERRRKVVCKDARLILINTDPAGNRRPSHLRLKPKYLCEYGLPEYQIFKEEMISILAPNEKNEEKAMKKVISALQRSPMGKYQCMPQYLFQYVSKFKKHNFKWFKKWEGKQLEDKLHAIWKFLQDEKIQREACRGYVRASISELKQVPGFNNDPRYVRAAYYGGGSAGKALLARDLGTATEAQKDRVKKKQGDYISIDSYSGKAKQEGGKLKQFPPVNVEAVVSSIAGKESGSYQGQIAKPRDEKWEQDQRYAYNQVEQEDENLAVA